MVEVAGNLIEKNFQITLKKSEKLHNKKKLKVKQEYQTKDVYFEKKGNTLLIN